MANARASGRARYTCARVALRNSSAAGSASSSAAIRLRDATLGLQIQTYRWRRETIFSASVPETRHRVASMVRASARRPAASASPASVATSRCAALGAAVASAATQAAGGPARAATASRIHSTRAR